MTAGDDETRPRERQTEIVWPRDRVAKFWRAVRAGRAVTESMMPVVQLVARESDQRNM